MSVQLLTKDWMVSLANQHAPLQINTVSHDLLHYKYYYRVAGDIPQVNIQPLAALQCC